MEVGSTVRQTLEISGQQIELLCKVTGYESNERISLEYSCNGLSLGVDLIFESLDGSIRLTAAGEGQMGGFSALFEPLVEREINAQLKANLEVLKSFLEEASSNP
jgi:hypothetical protein